MKLFRKRYFWVATTIVLLLAGGSAYLLYSPWGQLALQKKRAKDLGLLLEPQQLMANVQQDQNAAWYWKQAQNMIKSERGQRLAQLARKASYAPPYRQVQPARVLEELQKWPELLAVSRKAASMNTSYFAARWVGGNLMPHIPGGGHHLVLIFKAAAEAHIDAKRYDAALELLSLNSVYSSDLGHPPTLLNVLMQSACDHINDVAIDSLVAKSQADPQLRRLLQTFLAKLPPLPSLRDVVRHELVFQRAEFPSLRKSAPKEVDIYAGLIEVDPGQLSQAIKDSPTMMKIEAGVIDLFSDLVEKLSRDGSGDAKILKAMQEQVAAENDLVGQMKRWDLKILANVQDQLSQLTAKRAAWKLALEA